MLAPILGRSAARSFSCLRRFSLPFHLLKRPFDDLKSPSTAFLSWPHKRASSIPRSSRLQSFVFPHIDFSGTQLALLGRCARPCFASFRLRRAAFRCGSAHARPEGVGPAQPDAGGCSFVALSDEADASFLDKNMAFPFKIL